jgi:hypothetical protein
VQILLDQQPHVLRLWSSVRLSDQANRSREVDRSLPPRASTAQVRNGICLHQTSLKSGLCDRGSMPMWAWQELLMFASPVALTPQEPQLRQIRLLASSAALPPRAGAAQVLDVSCCRHCAVDDSWLDKPWPFRCEFQQLLSLFVVWQFAACHGAGSLSQHLHSALTQECLLACLLLPPLGSQVFSLFSLHSQSAASWLAGAQSPARNSAAGR